SAAVVFRDGLADGIQPGKQDEAALAVGTHQAVDRRRFLARGPTFGNGQPLRPGEARILTPLHYYGAPAVPLWINDDHGLVVLEQHRCGVTQVLSRFPVDHNLAVRLAVQIDEGNSVAPRRTGLGRGEGSR